MTVRMTEKETMPACTILKKKGGRPTAWAGAVLLLLLATLFTYGMGRKADTLPPDFAVHTLLRGSQSAGSGNGPSAEWVRSRDALERVFADAGSLQLSASESDQAPDVDLAAYRVLLVRMGRKPTAGYAVRCLTERSGLTNGTAVITLEWAEPPPDRLNAQVVTSPFVLLKITKAGYSRVKLVDQDDRTLFELEAPQ